MRDHAIGNLNDRQLFRFSSFLLFVEISVTEVSSRKIRCVAN